MTYVWQWVSLLPSSARRDAEALCIASSRRGPRRATTHKSRPAIRQEPPLHTASHSYTERIAAWGPAGATALGHDRNQSTSGDPNHSSSHAVQQAVLSHHHQEEEEEGEEEGEEEQEEQEEAKAGETAAEVQRQQRLVAVRQRAARVLAEVEGCKGGDAALWDSLQRHLLPHLASLLHPTHHTAS
jgi:hypothetical protein